MAGGSRFSLFLSLVVAITVSVQGFPIGAPEGTCNNMMPRHPSDIVIPPNSPYNVSTEYNMTENIVHIRIFSNPQPNGQPAQIRGLFLQVRNQNDMRKGTLFIDNPEEYQFVNCSAFGGGHGVTHRNESDKETPTFRWQPPTNTAGETYTVVLTSVQNFASYWTAERFPLNFPYTPLSTEASTTPMKPYTTTEAAASEEHTTTTETPVFQCFSNGNVYTPTAGCTHYNQTAAAFPSGFLMPCPGGLLFDTIECACNFPYLVECPV